MFKPKEQLKPQPQPFTVDETAEMASYTLDLENGTLYSGATTKPMWSANT